jgi:hypothetical protein
MNLSTRQNRRQAGARTISDGMPEPEMTIGPPLPSGLDASDGPLGDDALLPSQIGAMRQRAIPDAASKTSELFAAILASALHDLRDRNRRVRADARRWFERPDSGAAISLAMVCDALGLDVGRVQAAALRR